ncbi:MAG TPA: hypothetical protein VKN99_26300 [Polyangia bacterium]|nr:hypothetical protein [Polyangia bacterium]
MGGLRAKMIEQRAKMMGPANYDPAPSAAIRMHVSQSDWMAIDAAGNVIHFTAPFHGDSGRARQGSLLLDGKQIALGTQDDRFALAKTIWESGYHVEWKGVRRSSGGGILEASTLALRRMTPLELEVQTLDYVPYQREFALYDLAQQVNGRASNWSGPIPIGLGGVDFDLPKPPGYDRWQAWFSLRKESMGGWLPESTWARATSEYFSRYARKNVKHEMSDVQWGVLRSIESEFGVHHRHP